MVTYKRSYINMRFLQGYYLLCMTIVQIDFSSGVLCEDASDLEISAITERSVQLSWTQNSSPYRIEITPLPCGERDNYVCQCEEDTTLSFNQTSQDETHFVNKLFPGRQYLFDVYNDNEDMVATNCSYTVPRKPTLFTFDDDKTLNPLVDAVGVVLQMPWPTEPSNCNPDEHTEFSNYYKWSAENVSDGFILFGNIDDPDGENGLFNFVINTFSAGQEYKLYISATSGNVVSENVTYEINNGQFKTALYSVTDVDLTVDSQGYPQLFWYHSSRPRDGYLVRWVASSAPEHSADVIELDNQFFIFKDLYPGYNYTLSVETYKEGFEQQDPPISYPLTVVPPRASNIVVDFTSMDEINLSWIPPVDDFTEEYMYNISVEGEPCVGDDKEFCDCREYGNRIYMVSGANFTIPDLYSGRKYIIDFRTVTTGEIPSAPLPVPLINYTVPRAPKSLSIQDTESTNTTLAVSIHRISECGEATEVHGYEIYTQQTDNIVTNSTYFDGSNAEEITQDILDLIPGEMYDVCVSTIGSNQLKSSEECIMDAKTKINAPSISIVLGSDGKSIDVSWFTLKREDLTIDGYLAKCESTQSIEDAQEITLDNTVTEHTFTGLTPGSLYKVSVDAIKAGFEQHATPGQNVKTSRTTPQTPQFDIKVRDASNIDIFWNYVGYLDNVAFQFDLGNITKVQASAKETTIENLQPNAYYDISIWGVAGENGLDDYEEETSKHNETKQMLSAEVTNLIITVEGSDTLLVEWEYPTDNDAELGVNHYIADIYDDEDKCLRTVVFNNTKLSHQDLEIVCGNAEYKTFNGNENISFAVTYLDACTPYTIKVYPVNTAGKGEEASSEEETEVGGPEAIVDFDITPDTDSITVEWPKPKPLKCEMASSLLIEYKDCYTQVIINKSAEFVNINEKTKHEFPDLQPFTNHSVTLMIYNEAGNESSTTDINTLSTVPGTPDVFQVNNVTHDVAELSWTELHECEINGPGITYLYKCCPKDLLSTDTDPDCDDEIEKPVSETPLHLTNLDAYYRYTCYIRATNDAGDGVISEGTQFETNEYKPDEVTAVEVNMECQDDTEFFVLKIDEPAKKNGPLTKYEIFTLKEGSTCGEAENLIWTCRISQMQDECVIKDSTLEVRIQADKEASQIQVIAHNSAGKSDPKCQSVDTLVCPGTGSDIGLIVGLTFMSIAIIVIILGLIYAKMKRVGPFNDSDTGFNYLDGQSMEAVPVGGGDTPNNHTVAGTANAAFIKEDDIEVVESSSPIQIDQFEAYCNDAYGDSQYKMAEQFGVIKKQSPVHEGIECRRPENKPKNRYTNILPFDWSLVKLKTRIGVPFSEYINATYIPGEWGKDEYIATQGPVTETIDDFWRMVWEQETPIVIMLTVFVQNNKAKCVMYWPEAGSTMVCGDILVTTKSSDSWGFDDQYRTREIHLKCNDQVRVITQYQMVEWPDYGCPDSPDELLDLVETVRQQCPDDRMTRLVVHCSAGVGRTGTYIAVDRLRQQLDNKEPTDTIDIQAMISEMREYRPHMVQTEAQYTYIHECVNAMLLRKHGQNVDNGEVDIYENTDYPRKVSAESADSDNPTMSGAMPYPIKVSADSTDSDKPTMSGTMSMSVIV